MDSEVPASAHQRAANAQPTRQMLADRMIQHQDEKRRSATARRRVGMSVPSEAEIASVLSARRAAVVNTHEAQLLDDATRMGVTALRCHDVTLDEITTDVFQPAVQLSDVQVRQDLVRPLNKLMAILALRLRLASVLKTLAAAQQGAQVEHRARAAGHGAVGECGGDADSEDAYPLPTAASLPQLSTLLRELPLPDLAAHTQLHGGGLCPLAAPQLFDTPHSRPCHDAFAYRLRHFAPVEVPPFALDIAAAAERETQAAAGWPASPSTETADVPLMAAPPRQPSSTSPAALMPQPGVEDAEGGSGPTATLAGASAAARHGRHGRALATGQGGANSGGGDGEAFPSLLPRQPRSGAAAGLVQPQTL